jgi:hypothetical protein
MKNLPPLVLILLGVAVALGGNHAPTPAPAVERSIVDCLDAPEYPKLGEPIVITCTLPEGTGPTAYDWRVTPLDSEGRAAFVPLGDGKTIHVWATPGVHEVELVIAYTGDSPLPIIVRREANINVEGAPPPPDPADDFRAAVREAVPHEADRADLAALAAAMADTLESDGRLSQPKITDTLVLGRVWSDLQRNYHGGDAPYGDRLAEFETLCADSLARALELTGDALPLDLGDRRARAARWYRQLAEALQ